MNVDWNARGARAGRDIGHEAGAETARLTEERGTKRKKMREAENGTMIKRVMVEIKRLTGPEIDQKNVGGVKRKKIERTRGTEMTGILERRGGTAGAEVKIENRERARALVRMQVAELVVEAKKGQTDIKQTGVAGAQVETEQTVQRSPRNGSAAPAGRNHANAAGAKNEGISVTVKTRTMITTAVTLKKSKETKMRLCNDLQ